MGGFIIGIDSEQVDYIGTLEAQRKMKFDALPKEIQATVANRHQDASMKPGMVLMVRMLAIVCATQKKMDFCFIRVSSKATNYSVKCLYYNDKRNKLDYC